MTNTEKKLTAVEWLVENTPLCKNDFYLEQINQAKEKEKQQLYDFYDHGHENPYKSGEQYYNETFKK
jgi:hypothetical protein